MDFMEKQARMLSEIVDVFERNDANLFEMYRVLAIAFKISRENVKEMFESLDEQADVLMGAIDGLLESE